MPKQILETERLVLRELAPDDVDALLVVLGDAEAMKFYPAPFSRSEVEGWISRSMDRYDHEGHGLWAVIQKSDGLFLGDCGLIAQTVEGRIEIEVGYHIRRDHWRRGFATEAARACRDYGFTVLGAPRVISLVHPENMASRRVAEKVHHTMRMVFWERVAMKVCCYISERPGA